LKEFCPQEVSDIVFGLRSSGGVTRTIHREPSCGGIHVARCAQDEIRLSVEKNIIRRQGFEEE
jgi:hypothetical protein